MDLEWNVDQTPGQYRQGQTAVVSIAYEKHIYIFQIARLHGNHFPVFLKNFLAESHILKVGRGIGNDLKRLQKESKCTEAFTEYKNLARMAKDCHMSPNAQVGLAELSALVLKARLVKAADI